MAFVLDDRIFLGEGLFETLKVVDGKPCCAFLHWQRLHQSAQQLGMTFNLPFEHWQAALLQKIQQDNLSQGGIKAILSGGSAPRGLAAQGLNSQLQLQTFQYTIQTQPLRLMSAPWLRDASNPVYQVKSINYLEAILARRQALAMGFDEVLFFNTQQHATETTCANLFVIQKDCLLTPPLTDGVLPGITRSRILALNINYQEMSLTKALIAEADAVFITNSLQGVQTVLALDSYKFVEAHPLVANLQSALSV